VGGATAAGVGGAHGDILGHEGAALGSVDTVNAGVTPVEHGLVLPSGPLIHGGTGGYGGMNPPVTDAPAPQVPARAQPMTTAAEHTPAVTQPQHTPVEPPVHDKPPSHSVFDVGHEPPVTHTPPAPIELPSYGLFGLPGF
ncbi:Isoniazid-inducible protein iniB, partial [Mycobacterium tuberculosis]